MVLVDFGLVASYVTVKVAASIFVVSLHGEILVDVGRLVAIFSPALFLGKVRATLIDVAA